MPFFATQVGTSTAPQPQFANASSFKYRPPSNKFNTSNKVSNSSSSSSISSKSKINPDNFYAWTKSNIYKTTNEKFYNRGPPQQKTSIIPGYGGYIPGNKAKGYYAKSKADIAKETLNDPNLGTNKFHLSTTGFNLRPEVFVDKNITAMTHKYGAQTIPKTHPAVQAKEWVSHTHATFKDPKSLSSPIYRPDWTPFVNKSAKVYASGFGTNRIPLDGQGPLHPVTNIAEDRKVRTTTEYRARYNIDKPFHQNPTVYMPRKLKPFCNPNNLN